MKRVLFLGRFQPFHMGHLEVVKRLYGEYELIIGIGSANYSRTELNPFTADEREEMIKRVLEKEKINVKIVRVNDIELDDSYANYLFGIVKFDALACSNKRIIKYFKGKVELIEFPLFYNLSATKIRKNICNKELWKKFVHPEVYKYIKEINGEEIIRNIGYYDDE
ncbi:MAG: nicotinamide-nucleotide adenylyltransferase [Candidatus Woesearchaeota archaeon]